MLVQVDRAVLELQDRMGLALAEGERASHEAALQNLIGLVQKGDRTFRGHGAELDMRVLARLADERGLTQAQLAEALGVRQSTVGNWEAGRNNVSRETLAAVADALDVPGTELRHAISLPHRDAA